MTSSGDGHPSSQLPPHLIKYGFIVMAADEHNILSRVTAIGQGLVAVVRVALTSKQPAICNLCLKVP